MKSPVHVNGEVAACLDASYYELKSVGMSCALIWRSFYLLHVPLGLAGDDYSDWRLLRSPTYPRC